MVWTSEVETGSILVVKTKPDLRTKEGKNMYNRANYLNRKLKQKTVAMNAELETVCSSADGSFGCPTPYLSTPDGRSEYNRAYYKKRKAAGTLHGDTKRPYNRTFFPKRQPGNQGFRNTSCKEKPEDTPIAEGENTEDAEDSTSPDEKPEETPIAACENTEMERPCKIRKICGGVMPPGTYYIGDPSYVLGTPWTRAEVKDLRMNGTLDVLDRAHLLPDGDVPGWTEAYAERVKENEEDAQVKAIEKDAQDQGKFTLSNGREIVVFDTAYGPGLYTDCKGRRYLVQSRSICLTLAEGLDNMQQGNVIEYTEPFECVALVDSRPFSGKRPFSGGRVTIMHFGDEAGIETEFHHRSSAVKGQ